MNYEIRRACPKDIKRIIKLLHQVNMVHYEIRPDLFKPLTTKYDEQELEARGRHVGKALYEYVCEFARQAGCHNITLNVWEGNEAALSFYRNMGMLIQKTTMEVILR